MAQPKHMKNKEKKVYKKVILFFIIFIVVFLLVFYKDRGLIKYTNTDTNVEKKDDIFENEEKLIIKDEYSVENEKLVLKSNYEENKEKKIIYIFEQNVLSEVKVLEKYPIKEYYDTEKNKYAKRLDIELIQTDDEQMIIYYKKTKLESDEGLSYEQIYKKYMGIIGAYEVI